VKTTNDQVLATVYKKKGAALISIASWADTAVNVKLKINWNELGLNPARVKIVAPWIQNFQPSRTFSINEAIPVPKNKGWLLIVK
jgi:hypothetical protein